MNKNVLIVGASSGIGKSLAELYAADGCIVGVMARREQLLTDLQNRFPGKIFIKQADIGDGSADKNLNELAIAMNGADIIIVAASTIHFNEELDQEKEKLTLRTNVSGYTDILLAAWKYFEAKGGGQIAGITSIAAARGNKLAPAYHSSKAFQSTYLESLRVKAKFQKSGIIITELVPGYINTDMGKGQRMFWVASVAKAALQAKKAIARKKSRAFITKRWWFLFHLQL